MRGTTEVHERAAVRQHASWQDALERLTQRRCVYTFKKRVGLAARGSDEPTDALGGVSVDFNPWLGLIAW
jgi:hypothetical protein